MGRKLTDERKQLRLFADDFDGFFKAGELDVAVELGEDGFGAGQ